MECGGRLVERAVTVRVPASSANLGPGFDALGLALAHHDVVTAEVTGTGGLEVHVEGEGAGTVPLDETHLVHRSLVRGLGELGIPTPGLRLRCFNRIPHGRGLGSSSAAIVAGLALARALVVDGADRLDDDALFRLAAALEGHPDNVAAAVYGGFTIAWECAAEARAVSMPVAQGVVPVLLVPEVRLETVVARGLLPTAVPHADAAWNAGRAALLVAALTGRPQELMAATEDRLHQPYRAAAMPDSDRLLSALREAGIAAVISGAGPSVLALVAPPQTGAVVARAPARWRALVLDVDHAGVVELG